MEISRREVKRILGNIAGNVTERAGGWRVVAPGYRFDIEHEADLIEEVARVKGYDAVPVRMPRVVASGRVATEAGTSIDRVCSTLVGRGYYEAINFGFVDPRMQKLLGSGEKAISLANPIAENLSEMRTSLWPGLVATAVSNLNRQQDRIRLFEVGRVFARKRGKIVERDVVAGVVMGPVQPGQWDIKAREVDFYDVKSDVESLLSLTGKEKNFIFISLEHKSMQSGQVARIDINGSEVGWLGRLHPEIQRDAGSDRSVFLFELDLRLLLDGRVPRYQQISRFPAVRRDLALVLDDQVEAADVAAVLRGAAGDALVNLELFDVYRDSHGDVGPESGADIQTSSGLGVGRRSLAYRLTFQLKERTLTDAEVEGFVADALAELSTRYGAELRS
jgi:phenylalanyl-tRNA synthetase beta chain